MSGDLNEPVDRQELFDNDPLLHSGFELIVDDIDRIDSTCYIIVDGLKLGSHQHPVLKRQLVEKVHDLSAHLPAASSEKSRGLSDRSPPPRPVRRRASNSFSVVGRRTEDVGVECPAQTAVACHDGDHDAIAFPLPQQGMSVSVDTPAEVANRIPHLEGIRSCRENAVLHALELRRRHHFHGFRDFLGFLNGGDFPSDGLQAGHVVIPSGSSKRTLRVDFVSAGGAGYHQWSQCVKTGAYRQAAICLLCGVPSIA